MRIFWMKWTRMLFSDLHKAIIYIDTFVLKGDLEV